MSSYKTAIQMSTQIKPVRCVQYGASFKNSWQGKKKQWLPIVRQYATKPDHTESYWSLANLKTFSFLDEEIAAMENLLSSAGSSRHW